MDMNKNIWAVIFRLGGFDVSSISEHSLKKFICDTYMYSLFLVLRLAASNVSYWNYCKIHPPHLFTMCFFIPTPTLVPPYRAASTIFVFLILSSFLSNSISGHFRLQNLSLDALDSTLWSYLHILFFFTLNSLPFFIT